MYKYPLHSHSQNQGATLHIGTYFELYREKQQEEASIDWRTPRQTEGPSTNRTTFLEAHGVTEKSTEFKYTNMIQQLHRQK